MEFKQTFIYTNSENDRKYTEEMIFLYHYFISFWFIDFKIKFFNVLMDCFSKTILTYKNKQNLNLITLDQG